MSLESKAKTTTDILNMTDDWYDNGKISSNFLQKKWVPLEDAQKLEHLNIALSFALEAEQKMRNEANKIINKEIWM